MIVISRNKTISRQRIVPIPSFSTLWWTRPGRDEQVLPLQRMFDDKKQSATTKRNQRNNTLSIPSTNPLRGRKKSVRTCNPHGAWNMTMTTTLFAGASRQETNPSIHKSILVCAITCLANTHLALSPTIREYHSIAGCWLNIHILNHRRLFLNKKIYLSNKKMKKQTIKMPLIQ